MYVLTITQEDEANREPGGVGGAGNHGYSGCLDACQNSNQESAKNPPDSLNTPTESPMWPSGPLWLSMASSTGS